MAMGRNSSLPNMGNRGIQHVPGQRFLLNIHIFMVGFHHASASARAATKLSHHVFMFMKEKRKKKPENIIPIITLQFINRSFD